MGKIYTIEDGKTGQKKYPVTLTDAVIDNDGNKLTTVLSGKQDKITETNKLAYSLISGTPTIPTSISDLTSDVYLPFVDSYVADCNAWLTNGYTKVSQNATINHPSLCTGTDKWGILFFIAENATQGTGTQMYFPIDGTYKGRVFVRFLTNMLSGSKVVGEWKLLATSDDFYSKSEIDTKIGNIETLLAAL